MSTKKIQMNRVFKNFIPIALLLLVIGPEALAGIIAQGQMEWKAATRVGFDAGGERYPYTINGPGTLTITYTVSPYVNRHNYSSEEGLLQYENPGWTVISQESWYDGQPGHTVKSVKTDGSIRSYKSRVVYKVPAQNFSGSFSLIEPKYCGLNNCDRSAAGAMFTAEFIPEGQSGSGTDIIQDTSSTGSGNLERGVDRPGSDLNCHFPIASAANCQAMCQAERACVAFTWVKAGHLQQSPFNGDPICCLKASVPAARRDGCCISGVK